MAGSCRSGSRQLCDTRDASDFAEKIELLAADVELREKMGRANLMTIQKFSTEAVIKEMQNIYATELLVNENVCLK